MEEENKEEENKEEKNKKEKNKGNIIIPLKEKNKEKNKEENMEEILKSYINTKKKIENTGKKNYEVEMEIRFGKIKSYIFNVINSDPFEVETIENLYVIKNKKNVILREVISAEGSDFFLKEQVSSDYITYLSNKPKLVLSIERKYHDVNNKALFMKRKKVRKSKSMKGFRIDKTIIVLEDDKKEYEVELEVTDNNVELKDILSMVKEIQEKITSQPSLKQKIVSIVPRLDLNNYRFQKPVDVNLNDLRHKFRKGGSIGYKLDGIRMFVIVCYKNIYDISTSGNERILYENVFKEEQPISVFDAELVVFDAELVKDEYHIFDTIIYQGKDLSSQTLNKRLSCIPQMLYNLNKILSANVFFVKPHIFFRDFEGFKLGNTIIENKIKYFNCDDKYFNCDGIIYTPLGDYFETVYKWKRTRTVDFAYVDGSLKVSERGKLKNSGIALKHHIDLPNMSIVECSLETSNKGETKAIFIRKRPDKMLPNTYGIMRNYLKNTGNETRLLNAFKGIGIMFLRSYHNDVKRNLLNTGSGVLLHISSDKDFVQKSLSYKTYKKVFCIEPNTDNIKEPYSKIYSGDSGKELNFKELESRKFDVISAMFCLNLININNTLKLVDKFSKNGCLFTTVALSKEYIEHFFKRINKRKFSCSEYTIEINKNNLMIDINNTSMFTLNVTHFINNMKKIGFTLSERKRMLDEYFMSDNEYILSSMYEYVIMHKTGTRKNE